MANYNSDNMVNSNKRLQNLLNNEVCFNCVKCTAKNCISNKWRENQKLYKKLTGDDYNKI